MAWILRILKKIIRALSKPIRVVSMYGVTSRFRYAGKGTCILKPLRLQGTENITIGKNVNIHAQAWLAAKPLTGSKSCRLTIGDNCFIGDFCHIWATNSIQIERNVLIANHVYISDNVHGYANIHQPIIAQPIVQKNDVVIGEGSWLGENVCVIGASVGKNCVIGANSVVTRDIPDYCVAVGAPAHIIKRYDFKDEMWKKVTSKAAF